MDKLTVFFNGKQHAIEKVLNISSLSIKDQYKLDKIKEIKNIDTAVESSETKHLIITPFEGNVIALIKPTDLAEQIKSGKVNVSFCSKFLMKKLNIENTVIDVTPIQYGYRNDYTNQNNNPRRNDRPVTYTKTRSYNNGYIKKDYTQR